MNQIAISHEIPKQLFPIHDFVNDYPYVLAHLLLPEHYDKEYADFYREKLKESPYSILDNSLFELGDSIDYKELYRLGELYKPTHLILPDKSHNKEITMEQTMRYLLDYGKQSTPKFIGVLHGKSLTELLQMYYFYCTISQIDIIALPLNCLNYKDFKVLIGYKEKDNEYENQLSEDFLLEKYKTHRVQIVKKIMEEFDGMLPKKLHLLGCISPIEYYYYSEKEKENIHSIDSSAPIIYGWNNIDLSQSIENLKQIEKPKDKLAENLDIKLNEKQLNLIAKNVKTIRNIIN